MGAAYTQTGVLAKGRAKGSAGESEELGRELEKGCGVSNAKREKEFSPGSFLSFAVT